MDVLPFHLHPLGVGAEITAHIVDVAHLHCFRLDDGTGLFPRAAGIGGAPVPKAVIAIGVGLPVSPGHVYGLAGDLHVHGQLSLGVIRDVGRAQRQVLPPAPVGGHILGLVISILGYRWKRCDC